jgi:hypothetical protein
MYRSKTSSRPTNVRNPTTRRGRLKRLQTLFFSDLRVNVWAHLRGMLLAMWISAIRQSRLMERVLMKRRSLAVMLGILVSVAAHTVSARAAATDDDTDARMVDAKVVEVNDNHISVVARTGVEHVIATDASDTHVVRKGKPREVQGVEGGRHGDGRTRRGEVHEVRAPHSHRREAFKRRGLRAPLLKRALKIKFAARRRGLLVSVQRRTARSRPTPSLLSEVGRQSFVRVSYKFQVASSKLKRVLLTLNFELATWNL